MTSPTEGGDAGATLTAREARLRAERDEARAEVERLRAELRPQRHQAHYRWCNCLGDSDRCCDPSCCYPTEVEP